MSIAEEEQGHHMLWPVNNTDHMRQDKKVLTEAQLLPTLRVA